MPEPIFNPIPPGFVLRATAVDPETAQNVMGEERIVCAVESRNLTCTLPPGHDGPHEAQVLAIVTILMWGES